MPSLRLFIAACIPPQTAHTIAAASKKLFSAVPSTRVVPEENVHITLKFLGDTDLELVPQLLTALQTACMDERVFSAQLGRGALIPAHHPRTAVLDLEDSPELLNIFTKLDTLLAESELANRDHRLFTPHITIARFRKTLDPVFIKQFQDWRDISGRSFTISSVALFESELRPAGPTYNRLSTIELS